MNDDSASSYDLEQARQFLNVLFRKPGVTVREEPPPVAGPAYARLAGIGRTRTARPATAESATKETGHLPPEPALQTLTSWEDCLAWCMSLTRAEAAFVVDSQGFVIAYRGRIPAEGFEGAGAEMICSIEQLQRIAPDAGEMACVDIDFDRRRIVGFVAAASQIDLYAVVLVAPEPLSKEMKQGIIRQLVHSLPELD